MSLPAGVKVLPAHAQARPVLPWRTVSQHRAVIERGLAIDPIISRGFWWGDDNSIRRGRTGDMIQMLEDLARN